MNAEIQLPISTTSEAAYIDVGGSGGGASARNHSKPHAAAAAAVSSAKGKKLTLIPLIFLIYFEVSGGPYGAEPSVQAAGPLFALIGFVVFPFIWSIPEALITAELATAIPGNGGFVLWADRAFGPLAGFLMGSWKFLSGSINSAAYPVLCASYMSRAIPSLESGWERALAIVLFTLLLSFINYTGVTIVGYTAVVLGLVSLMPFVLMIGFAIPMLEPRRWVHVPKKKDWRLFLNNLFWNLNFWDNASTLAGEVEQPQRTFPRALLVSGILTCLGYFLPLLAGTGALEFAPGQWGDGFFADAAGMIAGKWLKYWIEAGAVLSTIGLYEAQLSSSSFQLLGMANLAVLPHVFGSRSKCFDTPHVGIAVSSAITLAFSFMTFGNIISSANFLYCLGMLLEFVSFLWLRWKHPAMERPYRVPLGLPGLVVMCLVPAVFLVLVVAMANWKVYLISAGLTLVAIGLHFLMSFCRSNGYLTFITKKEGDEQP